MRYGITLPTFLEWSDPRVVVDIAADAEGAGWAVCSSGTT
jgi:hypothetical protein